MQRILNVLIVNEKKQQRIYEDIYLILDELDGLARKRRQLHCSNYWVL